VAYRRYWLDEECFAGDGKVVIGEEAFHHIFVVCRMDADHVFEVIHPNGMAYCVQLESKTKKMAVVRILEERAIEALPQPYLHLIVAMSRFSKMDEIVEKAVELGAYALHPVLTDFSFVRRKSEVGESRRRRWEKIRISATEQCGRGDLMGIEEVTSLDEKLKDFNRETNAMGLFAYEGESDLGLREALQGLVAAAPQKIWVFIGSEGGFSEAEVQKFRNSGLQPVGMGPQILRVETACVAVLSAIKYEFGMMG
jgi:16S rRNA (uracil1498-N3)-methyltransferase